MARREQIVFLAQHLQLLNCVQWYGSDEWFAMDGVDYRDPQYSVPYSQFGPMVGVLRRRDDRGLDRFEVINPYSELVNMNLTPEEIPTLVPFLKDDRFMPTFSYHREFEPDRRLHQVNWAVSKIINYSAKRYLVNIDAFEARNDAEREKYLQSIVAWCHAYAGKSDEELILSTMKTTRSLREFEAAAEDAAKKGYKSALATLLDRTKDFSGFYDRRRLAALAFRLDTADAVPIARVWLKDEEEDTRFFAPPHLASIRRSRASRGPRRVEGDRGRQRRPRWIPEGRRNPAGDRRPSEHRPRL